MINEYDAKIAKAQAVIKAADIKQQKKGCCDVRSWCDWD